MNLFLIVAWMALAAVLRFTNLAHKALWADEFSTLIFSLGNRYFTVPLDRILSLNELLQPLQVNPQASIATVVEHLLTDSNHPPLYFALSHLWLVLFPAPDGLVSVAAARAFSAVIGILAVPATFWLGRITCQSTRVGHLAAVLMAASPFGIYLAQEARHYTLAVVWIIASLGCLVVGVRSLDKGRFIPLGVCLTWVVMNGLGFATHYFVLLTLVAEGLVLLGIWLWAEQMQRQKATPVYGGPISPTMAIALRMNRWRLGGVALGTLATVLVWLPVLQSVHHSGLTRWLQSGEFDHSSWLDQVLRSLAGLITMIYLLPFQDVPDWGVWLSGAMIAGWLIITGPWLVRGWQRQWQQPENQIPLLSLGGFIGSAIALYLLLTFMGSVNIASVFRYQFFYFPAVIVLLGAALSALWEQPGVGFPGVSYPVLSGRVAVLLVVGFCILGGLTVGLGWGYQKTHRPDRVAQHIAADFQAPTLVAITHKNHGQTGRLMGVAWELRRLDPAIAAQTQFLLAHYDGTDPTPAIAPLRQTLDTLPRPLDVWRINFRSEANALSHATLTEAGCVPISKLLSDDGYRYQHYRCN